MKSWSFKSKTWMNGATRGRIRITNKSIGGATVLGAIGDGLVESYFHITDTTNTENFNTFINDLVQQIRPNLENRPYLVLDNHTAHKNVVIRPTLEQHFNVLWLPSYSCQFNSIETFWSILKRRYR